MSTDFTGQYQTPEHQGYNPFQAPQTSPEDRKRAVRFKPLFGLAGRASRKQFWLVRIASTVGMLLLLVGAIAVMEVLPDDWKWISFLPFGLAFILYFWLSVSVTVRRFHDRGKSGSWIFLNLIPYIGAIWVLIDCGFLPGTNGPNSYGESVDW